jgi:hypothetical protein
VRLNPGFLKADAVCDLLKQFNPALMQRREVSIYCRSPSSLGIARTPLVPIIAATAISDAAPQNPLITR